MRKLRSHGSDEGYQGDLRTWLNSLDVETLLDERVRNR